MKLVLLCLVLVVAGCSSLGGAKGTPFAGLNEFRQGTGQVYIYRPSHFVMSLAIPTLEIDGKPAMSVRNASYTVYELEPGRHEFRLSSNGNWAATDIAFVADVKLSERTFYRLSTDAGSIFLIGSSVAVATINRYFGQVPEQFATGEMKGLLNSGSWP